MCNKKIKISGYFFPKITKDYKNMFYRSPLVSSFICDLDNVLKLKSRGFWIWIVTDRYVYIFLFVKLISSLHQLLLISQNISSSSTHNLALIQSSFLLGSKSEFLNKPASLISLSITVSFAGNTSSLSNPFCFFFSYKLYPLSILFGFDYRPV